ncbi:MAG TPA: GAF domain-containing protein [Terriglobales bacterium]|nr:GAF domain-containing protein [Terriglobales bacterium]
MPHASPADGSDVNAALKLITQRALVLTRAAGAAIALNHKGSMICRASAGTTAPSPGCPLDVSSGFSAECIRTGKALRCDDSESDPRVDVLTCRRIGVRSILAAPILFGQNVVGLLEVFSPQQRAFNDEHLAVAERLAQAVLRTPPPAPKPVPPPKLLVELEPAHRVFFRNLDEFVFPRPLAPLKLTSAPARFWPDVFVPSRIPWEGLFQSLALHVMMLAVLGSTLQMLLVDRHPLSPRPFNKAEVIYYLPNEYASLLAPPSPPRPVPRREQPTLARETPLAVAPERSRPVQTAIAAPEIELKHDLKLLHLISLNSLMPAVPLSATGRTRLTTPPDLTEAVAPVPDLSTVSSARAISAPATSVIEPAPTLQQTGRQIGDGIGRPQVVSPAPPNPAREQSSLWSRVKAALGGTGASVIPPPPSVNGVRDPKLQAGNGLVGNGAQVVPPPPLVRGAEGSRRGTPDGIAMGIVPPPPSADGLAAPSRRSTGSLIAAGGQVVPPVPVIRGAGGSIRGATNATGFAIVPPPPSVNGFGIAGRQGAGSLPGVGAQVVPPPPAVPGGGNSIRGAVRATTLAVVGPPPSVNGLGNGGKQGAEFASGIDSEIVPPPPAIKGAGNSIRGTQNGTGVAVVPPPPSMNANASAGLGSSARSRMGSLPMAMALAVPLRPDRADVRTTPSSSLATTTTPGVLPPMDPLTEEPSTFEPVEVAVNLLGPTVPLPNSSYFSNQEIFLAEERVSSHQSRLIKLIYEFLPYQPKLSDYGPEYPALDKLRVTRDPNCDETLTLATSSLNTAGWPQAGRLKLNAKYLNLQEATLACYRTTADDYRRARERKHR